MGKLGLDLKCEVIRGSVLISYVHLAADKKDHLLLMVSCYTKYQNLAGSGSGNGSDEPPYQSIFLEATERSLHKGELTTPTEIRLIGPRFEGGWISMTEVGRYDLYWNLWSVESLVLKNIGPGRRLWESPNSP